MDDIEPIMLRPAADRHDQPGVNAIAVGRLPVVSFNSKELSEIFSIYGRHVAAGEWRDYAIDMLRDRAVFSVFRRSAERPLYRIEKNPKFARRQGIYSVIATTGLILKRGHDLCRVLGVFDQKRLHVIDA